MLETSATGPVAPRSDLLTTVAIAITAYNPIGPSLIVMSGVSSGFGAMAGLTLGYKPSRSTRIRNS